MKEFFKSLPLGSSAIALSLAVLGNILGPTTVLRPILGSLSFIIMLLISIKIGLDSSSFRKEMTNPIAQSSFSTFTMCISVLLSYVPNAPIMILRLVWLAALLAHVGIILVTAQSIILSKKVFPSYYVAFVGIVAFSVTSKLVQFTGLGSFLVWFGLASFIILTPFIFINVFRNELPKPALSTRAIFAAPLSLYIVGYFSVVQMPSLSFITFIHSLAILFYVIGLVFIIINLKKEVNPSIASYTFPMTISVLATLKVKSLYVEGSLYPAFNLLYNIQLIICIVVILYVVIQYLLLIFKPKSTD